MNLLTCILIAIPIGIIFIMLWIYNDYRNIRRKISLSFCCFSYFQPLYLHNTLMQDAKYPLNAGEPKREIRVLQKMGLLYKVYSKTNSQWEIVIRNNSSEDIRINWENMQFIVDGRTSEVKYTILAEAETPFAIIKSQAETSQKIGVTTYTANKANSRIYNKKEIRKGRNSSITIILPISIGKHPQFFTSFDFYHQKK